MKESEDDRLARREADAQCGCSGDLPSPSRSSGAETTLQRKEQAFVCPCHPVIGDPASLTEAVPVNRAVFCILGQCSARYMALSHQ